MAAEENRLEANVVSTGILQGIAQVKPSTISNLAGIADLRQTRAEG
jgi:hypothetical protein